MQVSQFVKFMFGLTIGVLLVGVVSTSVLAEENYNEAAPVVFEDVDPSLIPPKEFRTSDLISLNFMEESVHAEECQSISESTLASFELFLDDFESLIIHDDTTLRRGLSNGPVIYAQCLSNKEEFTDVLIHELGHTADLTYLQSTSKSSKSSFMDFDEPVYADDPSVRFYKLSWENETTLKPGIDRTDFVSTYAMTDPFEDFAESFIMYVRYGEIFRYLAAGPDNQVLRSKYFFMKYAVFGGKEFNLDKKLSLDALLLFGGYSSDIFDVTKLNNLV